MNTRFMEVTTLSSEVLPAPAPSAQCYVHHQFDDIEQQRLAESFGMWVFLATEALIFGQVHHSHSAAAQLLHDSIMRNGLADHRSLTDL